MATHGDKEVYRPAITDGLPSTTLWRRINAVIKGILSNPGNEQIQTRAGDNIVWR